MLARLGNVIYWACAATSGALVLAFTYSYVFKTHRISEGDYLILLGLCGIGWAFGWAVRYVLTPQT